MRTILCYGDSNTYGYNPVDGSRWDKSIRWTGRLQELLGDEYTVIEEGCNGRTTVRDDPFDLWKNGYTYLKPCLNSHKPIDVVVMMLGTNDLKTYFGVGAKEIAEGANQLVKEMKAFSNEKHIKEPQILLVSPPRIGKEICQSGFGADFDEAAILQSELFAVYYKEVAIENQCIFVNAADIVTPSKEDSLHLMPEEHEKLARAIYEVIIAKDNLQ